MKTINRINLITSTIENIAIFESELTRWFDANGYDVEKDLIKICADVPNNKNEEEERARVSAALTHYALSGYELNGITYVPVLAAASDVRKATSTWINREVAPSFWRWAMCGLTLKDVSGRIAINKYMAYIGLLASASKRFEEVFGKKIDIRRVVVVKDAYVKVSGLVDFVKASGEVEHGVTRELEINAIDGFGIHRQELTNGESCSLRPGPWGKVYSQATSFSAISAYAIRNGKKPEIEDYWGRIVPLKDIDIIICESCFKAAKLYTSWEQYCAAFEELGHNVCVCVREHAPKLKGMPYQQGQTLAGSNMDVEFFAQHSYNTVSKYTNLNEATGLLSKFQKASAKIYPAMLKESHTARTIQEKYSSKKMDMLGGRIPELGLNAFIAPDMEAFVQHLFGMEIVGSLKAGECACGVIGKGEVDITRNPHLDNAHVILNNVGSMAFAYAKTPTMFINIWDLTTIRLRCDYDGDHVWYSQNPELINLIHRTYDQFGNLPVDWEAPSAPKGTINKTSIVGYVSNLTKSSEIGLYADALTKMWATGYNRDVCDWLTYAGNVLIDAAKHGNVKVVKPDDVQENGKNQLPEFCRFAKADKDHPADSAYWTEERVLKSGKVLPARTAYSGSFLDQYSRRVNKLVPDTLEINGLDDLVFDSYVMLIKPDRKIGRLAGLSKKALSYDPESGKYEDGGLFQQIAFRHAAEWKSLINFDAFKPDREAWEKAKKEEAIAELIAWARAQYANNAKVSALSDESILDAVYDVVTRNIFNCKMSENMETAIKNAYWNIFGEKAYQTICANLGQTALEADLTIDEDDLD